MIVVNTQPFSLVYTLVNHPHLGYLLEPHIVQINSLGKYSLTHQRVFTKTLDYFKRCLQKIDYEIIAILDELDDDFIFKKFNAETKKKIKSTEFFNKINENPILDKVIKPFIEERMNKALCLLRGTAIFKTGNDNNPTSVQIDVAKEKASVLFHFKRDSEGTRYFPTIKFKGVRVEFMFKNAQIVCYNPAWMLLGNDLFDFEKDLDGKKLQPFLNKRFIQINKSSEEVYFNKFVYQLIEKYNVYAEGFEINTQQPQGETQLSMQQVIGNDIALKLSFKYNDATFEYGSNNKVLVTVKNHNDNYTFTRVKRNNSFEQEKYEVLVKLGLKQFNGPYFTLKGNKLKANTSHINLINEGTNKYDFLEWLNENHSALTNEGIKILQDDKAYFIGAREMKLEINEQKDWFDVQALVFFGEFKIPFIALRNYILKGIREFTLPNGMIAIIPIEWFGDLSGLLEFSTNNQDIIIDKKHVGLLEEIANNGGKYLNFSDKLDKIKNYGQIKDAEMPLNFKGVLRPYQQAGFNWFYFLKENQFGGCLADDMGLGKTIQTLALIQKEHELFKASPGAKAQSSAKANIVLKNNLLNQIQPNTNSIGQIDLFSAANTQNNAVGLQTENIPFQNKLSIESFVSDGLVRTSLIIVPNSLVFNWQNEAKKFTPNLKILVYTGSQRIKSSHYFNNFDLIITTYGTARVDADILAQHKFNYIILDESQSIKNASSQSSKAVRLLKSNFKLVLTGTPIENGVQELWSQLSFVNPGLLGSVSSFNERFVVPIEKGKDEFKMQQLKAIIKPFVLRRTKDQVAKDLPEKTEQIIYCQMTDEQAEAYETTKSYYRNEILKSVSEIGVSKSHFTLLKGLTKLRQIANHPVLANKEYEFGSGKFDEVIARANTAKAEGHKVLMFSQFVKQLDIYRKNFDLQKHPYSYLDGSMTNIERQNAVLNFQSKEDLPFFLISLKAGGLGLNLTNADYVFLIDPWWNPAIERQAVDRTHRIGQTKSVFIYKFITKDTVEEKIIALQQKKKLLADNIITTEESFMKTIDVNEIIDLLS
ncbi:MAG: DEAD/DEAH box helicase [Bacteroidota bacterium]